MEGSCTVQFSAWATYLAPWRWRASRYYLAICLSLFNRPLAAAHSTSLHIQWMFTPNTAGFGRRRNLITIQNKLKSPPARIYQGKLCIVKENLHQSDFEMVQDELLALYMHMIFYAGSCLTRQERKQYIAWKRRPRRQITNGWLGLDILVVEIRT